MTPPLVILRQGTVPDKFVNAATPAERYTAGDGRDRSLSEWQEKPQGKDNTCCPSVSHVHNVSGQNKLIFVSLRFIEKLACSIAQPAILHFSSPLSVPQNMGGLAGAISCPDRVRPLPHEWRYGFTGS